MTPKIALDTARRKWATAQNHFVLMHGPGLEDYAQNYEDFVLWAMASLSTQFLVASYTRSGGIEFPIGNHELIAREILPPGKAASSEFEALLDKPLAADGQRPFPTELEDALDYLESLMRVGEVQTADGGTYSVCVVFPYADILFPEAPIANMASPDRTALERLIRWADDVDWSNGDASPLILIMSKEKAALNGRLARKCAQIEVSAPDYDARLEHIEFELDQKYDNEQRVRLTDDFSPHQFAALTAGLTRRHISDLFSDALLTDWNISRGDVQRYAREVDQSQLDGVLVIEQPSGTLDDVAGHQHVVSYLRHEVIPAMLRGDTKGVPTALLLMGPPGTGKTHLAKRLAAESGMNFAELRISKILDMYVGESEKRMERALAGVVARFPCILFVDEIDQVFSRGGNDGNRVGASLFQRLLQFIGPEVRGKVLLVAATNRPDLIDGALMRSGRFDDKLAMFAPQTVAERMEMFEVLSGVRDMPLADDVDLSNAAERTQDYTGADIELVLNNAWRIARGHGLNAIDNQALDTALTYVIPNLVAAQDFIDEAMRHVNNLLMLPEALRDRVLAERRGKAQPQTAERKASKRHVRRDVINDQD